MSNKQKFRRFIVVLIVLVGSRTAAGGEFSILIVDREGLPVPGVAVSVKQVGVAVPRMPEAAIMDQRDGRFVPHVLVVEKGAAVAFPNSDIVAHHVYSFSRPNDFALPLYKGEPPAPVVFDAEGIVTLGCNIHDSMLAYIVVVDTPVFGITDDHGRLAVTVDDSATSYEVRAWSPRIRDAEEALAVQFAALPADEVRIELRKSLRPGHADQPDSVEWDEY